MNNNVNAHFNPIYQNQEQQEENPEQQESLLYALAVRTFNYISSFFQEPKLINGIPETEAIVFEQNLHNNFSKISDNEEKCKSNAKIIRVCFYNLRSSFFYFTNSELKAFPILPNALGGFRNIVDLSLAQNKLTTFPEAICSMKNLETLNMNENLISIIPDDIGELVNLKTLYFDDNLLTSMPNSFSKLVKLQSFFVSNNQITEFPENFTKLTRLQLIGMDKNKITKIPESFDQLVNLRSLHLNHNQIDVIPESFYLLTSLTTLYLGNNKLSEISISVKNLTSLINLDISGNSFLVFPQSICALTGLTNLYLDKHGYASIPDSFVGLENLSLLYLNDCHMQNFPEVITRLQKLESLYFNKNEITVIPETIGNLRNLLQLEMSSCRFTFLPDSLGNLNKLVTLVLEGNAHLRNLPLSLGNCRQLRYLEVDERFAIQGSAILERCEALRNNRGLLTLSVRIQSWKTYANFSNVIDNDLTFISKDFFDEAQLISIEDWLNRLEQCSDFRNDRRRLAHLVCNILKSLKSEDFKQTFFALLADNLTSCGDRAGMLLNLIYSAWQLHNLSGNKESNDKEKIDLMKGIAKTLLLRNTVNEMIEKYERKTGKEFPENVEIRLYYETTLKKQLGLITAIDHMSYEGLGYRPDIIQEHELPKIVENGFLEIFYNFTVLDTFLAKHTKFSKEYNSKKAKIAKEAQIKLERIEFFYEIACLRERGMKNTYDNDVAHLKAALPKELQLEGIENNSLIDRYKDENEYHFDCGKINQQLKKELVDLRKYFIESGFNIALDTSCKRPFFKNAKKLI